MAQVPNTTTFCLSDVTAVVGGTCLTAAFANACADWFDPSYGGTCTCLLNFRNYTEVSEIEVTNYVEWLLWGWGCMMGTAYLRCCDNTPVCSCYINSQYDEYMDWGQIPAGCYYVDMGNVLGYDNMGQQISIDYCYSDSYGFGTTPYTQLFSGNNYVYYCLGYGF